MKALFFVSVLSLLVLTLGQNCNCGSGEPCCSQYGWCGNTAEYCSKDKGCKSGCWGDNGGGSGNGGDDNGSLGPIDKQDRYGADLQGITNPVSATGASDCQKQCHNTNGCVAWAFDTCGTNCWLKKSGSTTKANSCRVSGVLKSSGTTGNSGNSGNSGKNSTGNGGSGSNTGGGGSSTTGGGGGVGPSGLTDCQQEIIFRVTSVFETGQQDLKFEFCDYENDGQGYDAGFMSATSRSGAILGIVQYYCKVNSGAPICGLIPALQKAVGSQTKNGLGDLCDKWKSAANDKAFRNAQWQYTIDNYFSPATKHAKDIGLTLPLGLGELYDCNIQLGDGNDQNSLGGIINTVNKKVGKPAQAGQVNWLNAFLQERTNAEYRIGGAYPGTVYRIKSYKHVVDKGQAEMKTNTVEFLNNSGGAMQVTCKGNLH